MGKITVREYLNDKTLLETKYTPYSQKCLEINNMLKNIIGDENELAIWNVDYSHLEPVKYSLFIDIITNINMNEPDSENGLLGFDYLQMENALDELLEQISEEFKRFDHILDLKLLGIKEHFCTARVILDFQNYINDILISNPIK